MVLLLVRLLVFESELFLCVCVLETILIVRVIDQSSFVPYPLPKKEKDGALSVLAWVENDDLIVQSKSTGLSFGPSPVLELGHRR